MKKTIAATAVLLAALTTPAFAEHAVIRGLDKVTGHAHDYTLTLGRPARIGTLEVIARACDKNPPEERPEVRIYVDVFDHPPVTEAQPDAQRVEIFHGWMFASSPGLNGLEHPNYDIWAIDCRD